VGEELRCQVCGKVVKDPLDLYGFPGKCWECFWEPTVLDILNEIAKEAEIVLFGTELDNLA